MILHQVYPNYVSPEWIDALNDPQLMRFSEQRHRHHTLESCRRYVASHDVWGAYVEDRSTLPSDTRDLLHVGNIGLDPDFQNKTVDISLLMFRSRSGYGTRALDMACGMLANLGFRKLTLGCMDVNEPMKRLAVKCGFVEEARKAKQFLWEGKDVDGIYFARFA